jgi:hypothetical protein
VLNVRHLRLLHRHHLQVQVAAAVTVAAAVVAADQLDHNFISLNL